MRCWCKLGENPSSSSLDIMLTSLKSAISRIFYSIMTLTFDLLTPKSKVVLHGTIDLASQ